MATEAQIIPQNTPYEHIISQPVRKAIMASILSRPDASLIEDILHDETVPFFYGLILYHLKILVAHGILARHRAFKNSRNWVYYITSNSGELQATLQRMFPDAFQEQ